GQRRAGGRRLPRRGGTRRAIGVASPGPGNGRDVHRGAGSLSVALAAPGRFERHTLLPPGPSSQRDQRGFAAVAGFLPDDVAVLVLPLPVATLQLPGHVQRGQPVLAGPSRRVVSVPGG